MSQGFHKLNIELGSDKLKKGDIYIFSGQVPDCVEDTGFFQGSLLFKITEGFKYEDLWNLSLVKVYYNEMYDHFVEDSQELKISVDSGDLYDLFSILTEGSDSSFDLEFTGPAGNVDLTKVFLNLTELLWFQRGNSRDVRRVQELCKVCMSEVFPGALKGLLESSNELAVIASAFEDSFENHMRDTFDLLKSSKLGYTKLLEDLEYYLKSFKGARWFKILLPLVLRGLGVVEISESLETPESVIEQHLSNMSELIYEYAINTENQLLQDLFNIRETKMKANKSKGVDLSEVFKKYQEQGASEGGHKPCGDITRFVKSEFPDTDDIQYLVSKLLDPEVSDSEFQGMTDKQIKDLFDMDDILEREDGKLVGFREYHADTRSKLKY